MYLETEKYGKATPIVDEFLGKWSPNLLASFVALFLNVSRPLRLIMGAQTPFLVAALNILH